LSPEIDLLESKIYKILKIRTINIPVLAVARYHVVILLTEDEDLLNFEQLNMKPFYQERY